MRKRRRRFGRLLVARRSRIARKAERYIAGYDFPRHIGKRVRKRLPEIDGDGWTQVEQGLREWFVCCAWRGRTVLGMPSRAVDEAWHEFILDSPAYTAFCEAAFGGYLHHTPDEAMRTPMVGAMAETVRAWDRSEMGRDRESILWDLDERLRIGEPLGIDGLQLAGARSHTPYAAAGGWACVGMAAGGFYGGGGDGGAGGGCSGGGCSGGCGGGCGGGGCGGGG